MFAALEQRFLRPIIITLKKTISGIVIIFLALIFLLIGLVFFSFAAYSALLETRDPASAALVTGGGLAGLAVILLIVAMIVMRSKPAKSAPPSSTTAGGFLGTKSEFRTGYPIIDLAQLALPLILPLREKAHGHVKERPVATSMLALAGGVIAGFFLLSRRPQPASRKNRR